MSKPQVNSKKKLSEDESTLVNPAKKQKLNKKVQDSDSEPEDIIIANKGKAAAKPAQKADTKKKAKNDSDDDTSFDEEDFKPKAGATKAAPQKKAAAKKEESSDSEEAPQPQKKAQTKAAAKKKVESSSDEEPVATKKAPAKAAAKPLAKATSDDEDSEEEVKPATKKAVPAKGKAPAKKQAESSSEEEDEKPVKGKAAATSSKPAAKKAQDSDEESEEAPKPAKDKKQPAKVVAKDEDEEEEAPKKAAPSSGPAEVIVKNLPWSSNEDSLNELFSSCGTITRVNLLKGYDGKSKGIAFITFDGEDGVNEALKFHGTDVDGRAIHVEKTTPKEDRQAGGQRRDQQQGGARPQTERDPNSTTVFVGNLSYNTTEDSVTQLFESCGKIKGVRLAKDREGNPRGFGHVEFFATDAIDKAMAKAGQKLDGRPIRVDFSGAKKEGGGDFGGERRSFGGGQGGFGGGFRGRPQADPSKKGNIGSFSGQRVRL